MGHSLSLKITFSNQRPINGPFKKLDLPIFNGSVPICIRPSSAIHFGMPLWRIPQSSALARRNREHQRGIRIYEREIRIFAGTCLYYGCIRRRGDGRAEDIRSRRDHGDRLPHQERGDAGASADCSSVSRGNQGAGFGFSWGRAANAHRAVQCDQHPSQQRRRRLYPRQSARSRFQSHSSVGQWPSLCAGWDGREFFR